jgi:sulfate/thiosulfate transport system substrate-binding protein
MTLPSPDSLLFKVYGTSKALPYVVPSPNIRIECPLALVDRVLESRPPEARAAADAFARFLFTPEAQVEFGRVGFRTNRRLCRQMPEHLAGQPPVKLWTVDELLHGWPAAQRKFFDAGEVLDEIQADVGARRMAARRAGGRPAQQAAAPAAAQ